MLIKAGVATLDPAVLVLIRTGSASVFLLAVILLTRRRPFGGIRRRFPGFLFMAVTGSVIPFTAIAWGELHISSGLAAIFNATTPLWTAIIAYWLTPNERPSPLNYLGVAAGFAGTGILIAPQLGDPLHAGVLGSLAAIAGAASYAVAAIGQRRLLPGVDPIEGSFWQMGLATILILPIAAPALTHAHPTLVSVGASLVLGVAGSGVASILYYFLINSLGATRGASVTFLIPVTAVFWGSLLFQERITLPILGGMAVILLGVFLTSVRRRQTAATEARPAA